MELLLIIITSGYMQVVSFPNIGECHAAADRITHRAERVGIKVAATCSIRTNGE